MPINSKQLIELIIQPTLKDLNLYSLAAEQLLAGTCAQESGMGTYLAQVKGPAMGIFQMEPNSHSDLWWNFLGHKKDLAEAVHITCGIGVRGYTSEYEVSDYIFMEYNLRYACAMARIHYLRVKEPLPPANDIPALAAYYKKYYNTPKGAATEEQFIANWNKYCSDYYGVHNA